MQKIKTGQNVIGVNISQLSYLIKNKKEKEANNMGSVEFMYLVVLLITIIVVFVFYKRPIYEAMFIGYAVMIAVLGEYNNFFTFLLKPATNTLFYAIVAFLCLAHIFGETRVVDTIIEFMLALVGKFKGGAGYVSLLSSTFMAALSGSGPGNVAATGVFTIPTMIRSNFPRALAATVEMSASSLGPMIPPSGTILLAFGTLEALYPGKYQLSKFWIAVWTVGIYFIIQRFLTLYFFCNYYKVEPVSKEEIPDLKTVIQKGWKALLVPLIIFVPFLVDAKLGDTFLTARLGENGAKAFSKSVILFTPGIAAFYSILISRDKVKGKMNLKKVYEMLRNAVKSVTPVAATVYFAYCISDLFGAADVGKALGESVQALNMTRVQIAIFIPVLTTFLGMILPGSSQIAIFGVAFVGSLTAVGVNPVLAAAILPAITGALEGMTPPLALALFTAMGIADSGIGETSKLAYVWVFSHLIIAILILMGILPVLGI